MTPYSSIEDLIGEIRTARESHPAKIAELEKISESLNIAVKENFVKLPKVL